MYEGATGLTTPSVMPRPPRATCTQFQKAAHWDPIRVNVQDYAEDAILDFNSIHFLIRQGKHALKK